MPDIDNPQTNDDIQNLDVQISDFPESKPKVNWKSFIKFSGFTITFVVISLALMIIGLILFYKNPTVIRENVGFWIAFAGVIIFLLTVILGFEKVD